MSDHDAIFTDDKAALSFVGQLALEMVDVGEAHASLISQDDPEKREADVKLIKANSMMVFSSLFLMSIVTEKDGDAAKLAAKIWTSPIMAELNQIAFSEEINDATNYVVDSITDIEQFLNKENDESSSKPSDGSGNI
jgi:hypothetical protein